MGRTRNTAAAAATKPVAVEAAKPTLAERIAAVPIYSDSLAITSQFAAVGWTVVMGRAKTMLSVVPTTDAKKAGAIIMLAYASNKAETALVKSLWKLAMAGDFPEWASVFDKLMSYTGPAGKRFTADDNPTYGRLRSRSRKVTTTNSESGTCVMPCCTGHTPSGSVGGGAVTVDAKADGLDEADFDDFDE